MTEMCPLLKCPDRIIRMDFCSQEDDPLQRLPERECLTVPLPTFPLPSFRSGPPPAWVRAQLRRALCSATRQAFLAACESTADNGVALHRGSLRSFMAPAGVQEPITGTSR